MREDCLDEPPKAILEVLKLGLQGLTRLMTQRRDSTASPMAASSSARW
jgi:hypothetical protein